MHRLSGKVAIVTGAASGIGAATARLFMEEGARVLATDLHAGDTDWAAFGDRAAFLVQDVCDTRRWDAVFAAAADRFGPTDILANVAGINGVFRDRAPSQAPDEVELDLWREIQAVNVEGLVLGCKAALRAMAARGGAIVNVSSIAAQKGWPARAAYGASKAAVLQYTRTVARYAAERGWAIRCNAVLPGPIATPMLIPRGQVSSTGGDGRAGAGHVPLGRYGTAEEVARPLLFLASDEASYITGIGLLIDGGLSMVK